MSEEEKENDLLESLGAGHCIQCGKAKKPKVSIYIQSKSMNDPWNVKEGDICAECLEKDEHA